MIAGKMFVLIMQIAANWANFSFLSGLWLGGGMAPNLGAAYESKSEKIITLTEVSFFKKSGGADTKSA